MLGLARACGQRYTCIVPRRQNTLALASPLLLPYTAATCTAVASPTYMANYTTKREDDSAEYDYEDEEEVEDSGEMSDETFAAVSEYLQSKRGENNAPMTIDELNSLLGELSDDEWVGKTAPATLALQEEYPELYETGVIERTHHRCLYSPHFAPNVRTLKEFGFDGYQFARMWEAKASKELRPALQILRKPSLVTIGYESDGSPRRVRTNALSHDAVSHLEIYAGKVQTAVFVKHLMAGTLLEVVEGKGEGESEHVSRSESEPKIVRVPGLTEDQIRRFRRNVGCSITVCNVWELMAGGMISEPRRPGGNFTLIPLTDQRFSPDQVSNLRMSIAQKAAVPFVWLFLHPRPITWLDGKRADANGPRPDTIPAFSIENLPRATSPRAATNIVSLLAGGKVDPATVLDDTPLIVEPLPMRLTPDQVHILGTSNTSSWLIPNMSTLLRGGEVETFAHSDTAESGFSLQRVTVPPLPLERVVNLGHHLSSPLVVGRVWKLLAGSAVEVYSKTEPPNNSDGGGGGGGELRRVAVPPVTPSQLTKNMIKTEGWMVRTQLRLARSENDLETGEDVRPIREWSVVGGSE